MVISWYTHNSYIDTNRHFKYNKFWRSADWGILKWYEKGKLSSDFGMD